MSRGILFGITAFLLSVGAAQAGELFPPANSVQQGAGSARVCPNSTVLVWTGDSVVCTDPTPMITTTTCGAGQFMKGIQNGAPVCEALEPYIKAYVRKCRGPSVYYGVIQNVNAGVLSLNPSHLNGATQGVGNLFKCN